MSQRCGSGTKTQAGGGNPNEESEALPKAEDVESRPRPALMGTNQTFKIDDICGFLIFFNFISHASKNIQIL